MSVRPSFMVPCIVCLVVLLVTICAQALILVGRGNAPVRDDNWPAGSLAVANLKTRVGWWEGPPFGGGQHSFLYRGDAAAFQQTLDAFAKINAPRLDLFVHDGGPAHSTFLKDPNDPKSDDRYDWSFTVWNPQNWNHLYNTPGSYFSAQDPSERFGRDVDPPRIDVFVGNTGIDFAKVKVPDNATITDERADANGFRDGSAVAGDAYDQTNSKPIAGASVTIEGQPAPAKGQPAASAKTDAMGHFVLRAVPPGYHRVCIAAEGYAPRFLGYAEFHDNTFRRFTARLAPAARVRGTLEDTDGKPVADATIRADSILGPDGRGYIPPDQITAQSDANGKFELNGLPRGGHAQLFAYGPHHAMLDVLALHSISDDPVTIRMTATGTIKVRVLGHDGKPATHGNVNVEPPSNPVGKWGGSANTNPDGTFTFENVPPGTYVVTAMATNPGPALKPTDPKKTITVTAGQTIEVEITGR